MIPNEALAAQSRCAFKLGATHPLKNSGSHIDASLSRQPLVKGERLVRLEVNAVMVVATGFAALTLAMKETSMFLQIAQAFHA